MPKLTRRMLCACRHACRLPAFTDSIEKGGIAYYRARFAWLKATGKDFQDHYARENGTAAIALRHVANLAIAARKGIKPAPSLAHEAFEVAQWANKSSAAAAIQEMSGAGADPAPARRLWRGHSPDRPQPQGRSQNSRRSPSLARGGDTKASSRSGRGRDPARRTLTQPMPHSQTPSRLPPKRCRPCLAPTKHLYFFWWGPTRATFLRLRARVSSGGRFRSARRTYRQRSPSPAAA